MSFELPDYYLDSQSQDGNSWRFDVYDQEGNDIAWLVFNAYDEGLSADTFDGQAHLEDDLQYYTDVADIVWQEPFQLGNMSVSGVYFTKSDVFPCETLEYTAYHPGTGYTFWCCATQAVDAPYDYLQDCHDMMAGAQYVGEETGKPGSADLSVHERTGH